MRMRLLTLSEMEERTKSADIAVKCSDPERAIKFLDFLTSKDGNFLTFYGTKGGVWDIIDGNRQIKPEVIPEFQNDVAAFWKK